MKYKTIHPVLRATLGAAATVMLSAAIPVGAQTVTDPCPNRVISWDLDDWSTINPMDLAGLAPATNWVDTFLNDITIGLPDNTGAPTTLDLGRASFNTWHVQANHPGYDANGTANRELLNGYLNAGPANWNPPITNTIVSLTNIPYASYDVIVYFNSDESGRNGTIEGPNATYSFSTMGSAVRSGANALFMPTVETNSSVFPTADFAVWRGLTSPNARFTTYPKSGDEKWLGICGFQVVESSKAYCIYGPYPAAQIVPLGQPVSFSVIAGGQNIKYQWRHASVPIPNATNATHSILATAAGQDGDYDVVITNGFSAVTSSVATLTFYSPKSLEWAGTGATWDTASAFWTGGATIYTETDNVLFGQLGSGQPYVTLDTTHMPSSVTVSNGNYTFAGGSLAGPGSMHLKNNATLILDTPDATSGSTLIDAGSTLEVAANGTLGSGALTNNGALVFNKADDFAYGFPVRGFGNITNNGASGTITLGNNVTANHLVQSGFGTLLLQGSNSISTGVVADNGVVWARSVGALGGAPVQIGLGELLLAFNINYIVPSTTISGGTLHGGSGGNTTLSGSVTLTTDSTIAVDGGWTFTLSNPAGLNGSTHIVTKTGDGTLILPGTNNTWMALSLNAGTVQIGNGGGTGNLPAGLVADEGTLAFNLSTDLVVPNDISGGGGVAQNGSGTVTLTSPSHSYFGPTTVNSGRLLIDGILGGGGEVVVNGGSLGGTGTVYGPTSVLPGGTLAPGDSVGTMNIFNTLTIGGSLVFEVNKSLSPALTNDYVEVSGVSVTNNGTLTVVNLGPSPLSVGDQFTLFSQPVVGGSALSVGGAGVVWTNKLELDGSIQVVSTTVPQPHIVSTIVSGGNLVFSGTNGAAGSPYQVVSSTNVTAAMATWTQIGGGNFDGSGNFSVTNAIDANEPQRYFRLRLP